MDKIDKYEELDKYIKQRIRQLNKQEEEQKMRNTKCEIYRDSFQNYKGYAIPPAQLVIADIPYNIGNNFYGSNPMWYKDGDRQNGESKLAGKAAFNSDFNFNIAEYFHFCNKLLKKEPKKGGERRREGQKFRRSMHDSILCI